MLDQCAINDGRHLPEIVINEDASTAAGTARYRATCSCGRMPQHPAGTREQAVTAHTVHVNTCLGPSKPSKWLPRSARVAILTYAMLSTWAACYVTGQVITHHYDLTKAAATIVLAGSHLIGLTLAFGLRVAVRRYKTRTRA